MKDYIFFDLDGTLTDSEAGIKDSLRITLEHYGVHKTDEELVPFLGPALWESLPKYAGFKEEDVPGAVEIFRKHYNEIGIFNNKVYPGVVELLEKLKAAGKHIVLATGKPEVQANIVLNHFDLAKYFEFIGGSTLDVSRSKKGQVIAHAIKNLGLKDEDKSRIIMVGDRDNDINGAHENGLEVIAVLYGYGNQAEFDKAGADYICESVEELGEMLVHRSL